MENDAKIIPSCCCIHVHTSEHSKACQSLGIYTQLVNNVHHLRLYTSLFHLPQVSHPLTTYSHCVTIKKVMADEVVSSTSPEAGSSSAAPDRELIPARRAVEEEDIASYSTHDVHGASVKIQRAREAYKAYARVEEKPKKVEVLSWYFYELCSHFVLTVLVPIVFPLILSQIIKLPESWDALSAKSGATCTHKEINL